MTPELDYRAIRSRVNEGLKEQKFNARLIFFLVSLMIFILFMLMGWGMFLSNGGLDATSRDNPLAAAMVLTSLTGFLGVLFQGIGLSLDTKAGEDSLRERLVAREIGKEMMQLGADPEEEKRKHSMRLSDDGELEEVVEDVAAPESKRQQHS